MICALSNETELCKCLSPQLQGPERTYFPRVMRTGLLKACPVLSGTLVLPPLGLQPQGPFQPTLPLPRHLPVIFLLKIADRDDTGATTHSKLVLLGRPAHTASSAVDPQDDECGLPRAALQRPHVGIAVCAAGHDAVTLRGPVDACEMVRNQAKVIQAERLPGIHVGGA